MWSLPDIKRLNDNAAAVAFKAKCKREVKGTANMPCEFCEGPAEKDSRQLWYDIFSDNPKGVLGLCKQHERDYGSVPEGYFYCEACERLFIENYTWERYSSSTEDGGIVCLNCRAKEHIENDENWIPLKDESIGLLTFDEVRRTPHLIAVSGPTPRGIKFFDNVELDSSTGGRLTSYDSSEPTPNGGVDQLKETLKKARAAGHRKAILILDAAYQFSVSIGVYVRA